MHVAEALACELPIIYGTTGSIPEYAAGHGVPLPDPQALKQAIIAMRNGYQALKQKHHSYTSQMMCEQYEKILLATGRTDTNITYATKLNLRLAQGALWLRNTLA